MWDLFMRALFVVDTTDDTLFFRTVHKRKVALDEKFTLGYIHRALRVFRAFSN